MIGKLNRDIDASVEYERLARDDERIGLKLKESGDYRHSIYFLIQAMEKYVRAKTFSLIDARQKCYRDQERNDSVESALGFLIDIVSGNRLIRDQIKKQLHDHVLGDIRFNHLHNNLRYPIYSERNNSYASLEVTKNDAEIIAAKLASLKLFLDEISRFK